jgi:hypothetical protein
MLVSVRMHLSVCHIVVTLQESSDIRTADDASIESVTMGISAVSCKVLNTLGTELDTGGRAARWAVHFDRLLSDNAGIDTFSVSQNQSVMV